MIMKQHLQFIQFVRKIYNEPNKFIPLHAPVFLGNEQKYVSKCIDSSFVSSIGKFVDQFEEMTAKYVGVKYAVATVNGTAALHISLLLAGVKSGDEVITQPLTFVATVNAIKHANATPVFVDVDRDTKGMSPEKLEYWLKKNTIKQIDKSTNHLETINRITKKRISAIVPMHTFGHPCRIDEIVKIADRYNIPVVEDSAESLGSFYKGRHTGTFGKLGVFSYNGNKTITTGAGGMIVTNDEDLAKRAKHITTTAKVPHPYEYVHDEISYNYRLANINAALGVAQMENIDIILNSKRETALKYKYYFEKSDINFITEPICSKSNYWLNAVVLKDKAERDIFLEETNAKGVMTRPIWTLMNKLEMFKTAQCGNLDNALWLEDRVVNIPSSVRI